MSVEATGYKQATEALNEGISRAKNAPTLPSIPPTLDWLSSARDRSVWSIPRRCSHNACKDVCNVELAVVWPVKMRPGRGLPEVAWTAVGFVELARRSCLFLATFLPRIVRDQSEKAVD